MRKPRTLAFLCTTEESPVLLERKVDLNQVRAGEELDDHARGDDGGNAKLHESTTVGGENDTHPVERVCRIRRHDTVKGDLGANKEDEESDGGP